MFSHQHLQKHRREVLQKAPADPRSDGGEDTLRRSSCDHHASREQYRGSLQGQRAHPPQEEMVSGRKIIH